MNHDAPIRLIALDLDHTLLRNDRTISDRNRSALNAALEQKVQLCLATGRAKSALPKEVLLAVPDIRYAITSNGAVLTDLATGKEIYRNILTREAVESIWPYLADPALMSEIYFEGAPYVPASCCEDLRNYGIPEEFKDYYYETRRPVADFTGFVRERIDQIENVNLIFADARCRLDVWQELKQNRLVDVTTSLGFNLEVGAPGMSKGDAVARLAALLDLDAAQVLCCGDNDNDVKMLEYAGIGVAIENGTPAAKAAADYVTATNEEDGVAQAIEKFVLKPGRNMETK